MFAHYFPVTLWLNTLPISPVKMSLKLFDSNSLSVYAFVLVFAYIIYSHSEDLFDVGSVSSDISESEWRGLRESALFSSAVLTHK